SVRAYPEGSWHDETLYRIATLIESQAQAQFGGDEEARDPKRMASLQKARAQALPHWQQLIERYPESPRVEQAHYHAGVLLSEQAHAASAVAAAGDRRAAARIDQALKDAADT